MRCDLRTWIQVDLDRIRQNYLVAMAGLGEGSLAIAVVKSNAYGHGALAVARRLSELGVYGFAVANIEEAATLRQGGITEEILILGYTPPELIGQTHKLRLTQTLICAEYADALALAGDTPYKCHFAIDTGMRRIGLDACDTDGCAAVLSEYKDTLNVTGIFTHLCVADGEGGDDISFTELQLERFERVRRIACDMGISVAHCLNSAGILYHKERTPVELRRFVRPGITLYGLSPRMGAALPCGITPALSWKTVVAMVKRIRRGESVGYGRSFTAARDMTLATLPVGYADGYPRLLSGRSHVIIRGEYAPVVGRICMNQITVDVSNICGVSPEDEVTLIGEVDGRSVTAEQLAKLSGTISYEILTGITGDIPRIYQKF